MLQAAQVQVLVRACGPHLVRLRGRKGSAAVWWMGALPRSGGWALARA